MSKQPRVIPEEIRTWIGEVTGAHRVDTKQVSGGASRQAWFVDAETEAGPRELFLRYDPREPTLAAPFIRCRSRRRSSPNCTGTVCRSRACWPRTPWPRRC